ncbi:MAG TPA: DUF6779 domain-containing protein [Geodermatophilus sp.]|nr:DUF6779 domain-containing protein [Geodermatophilus sp.]
MRTAGLVAGFLLAVAATAVVFLTENPQVLRLAVVGGAWAFVLAALATSRRPADPDAGDGEVAELRRAYEAELEREVAARREHELELENRLRREAEESMRAELDALRSDLAELSALRQELAGLGALREEMAALTSLRSDLAQLPELRADLGRLRTELVEQLSGEMLVERIRLRTQSIRMPAGTSPATSESRTLDATPAWTPEHTRGLPAVGPDDLAPETRQAQEVRAARPLPLPAPVGTTTFSAAPPPPPESPREWLAARSLLEPADPPRRRRTDEPEPAPAEQLTVERPVAQRERPPVPGAPSPAPADAAEESPGAARLAQILAESGATPPSGGRRRRRYREGDEADDVLARVLGRD